MKVLLSAIPEGDARLVLSGNAEKSQGLNSLGGEQRQNRVLH